jgi:hypothetical protein
LGTVVLDAINLFVGFDERAEVGHHVFVSSVIRHSTHPISITPIGAKLFKGFVGARRPDESTDFARIRFLIPWLMGFRGWAMFCDGSDMLVRDDISKLWAMRNFNRAVQVVHHDYKTLHPRKFVGTPMECDNRDYERKNWSSVMLIQCSHFSWRDLIPDVVERMPGEALHQFEFVRPEHMGQIPLEWNWLADEYGHNDGAKLLHWTAGIPAFDHYKNSPMAREWLETAHQVLEGVAL